MSGTRGDCNGGRPLHLAWCLVSACLVQAEGYLAAPLTSSGASAHSRGSRCGRWSGRSRVGRQQAPDSQCRDIFSAPQAQWLLCGALGSSTSQDQQQHEVDDAEGDTTEEADKWLTGMGSVAPLGSIDAGPMGVQGNGKLMVRGGRTTNPEKEEPPWMTLVPSSFRTEDGDFGFPQLSISDIPLTPDIFAILVVYFVQGALGLARLATTYFLKDDLGLPPAQVAALTGLFTLPWVLKPFYGFLSDGVPIFGYRRRSYLVLSGVLGTAAWLYLAGFANTPMQVTGACIASSLAVAVSDVVADSIVVEKARDSESADLAGGLQSLCWGSSAVGGIISAYFSGALLESMSARGVFALTAILPLLVTGIALIIDEKPILDTADKGVEVVKEQATKLFAAIRDPKIYIPALFIFLWQATPTSDSAFFYFITNDIGVGPEFLGRVRLGCSVASLVGVAIFQKYLREVRISTILFWSSIISVPLGMTQLLLITHVNRQLGIPDELFTFGDDVILTVLGQIAFMPTLVLAARLCPPGVEGTLFALLMSIFNGGGIVGSELGALLTKALGVTEKDFTNLWQLVIICNLSSLLPLPALRWIKAVDVAPIVDEEGGAKEASSSKGKRIKK